MPNRKYQIGTLFCQFRLVISCLLLYLLNKKLQVSTCSHRLHIIKSKKTQSYPGPKITSYVLKFESLFDSYFTYHIYTVTVH